jgi:hypothetical protein
VVSPWSYGARCSDVDGAANVGSGSSPTYHPRVLGRPPAAAAAASKIARRGLRAPPTPDTTR